MDGRLAVIFGLWLIAATSVGAEEAGFERGREVYLGIAGDAATARVSGIETSLGRMPCHRCHGRDAEGGREGSVTAPPIHWDALLARWGTTTPSRLAEFEEAVGTGRTPDGRVLADVMPRYRFDESSDLKALASFLRGLARDERRGIQPDAVLLSFRAPAGLERTAQIFSTAFKETIAKLAPRGIHGRRIDLAENPSACFAAVGAADHSCRTLLFPLDGLVGDEDPHRVRGAFAPGTSQIAALLKRAEPGGVVLAHDDGRTRRLLAEAAPNVEAAGWRIPSVVEAGPIPAVEVLVIGPPASIPGLLARVSGLPKVLGLADQLGPVVPKLARAGYRGIIADARPMEEEDRRRADARRYGQAAAHISAVAFAACGRDCTRSGFLRALDEQKVTPPMWPRLDFSETRLSGTREVTVREW